MSYIHSFNDTTPPARFDGEAWTRAKAEEAEDAAGPWTEIYDEAIAVDASPQTPDPVDLSVDSTLERGWFRFRFEDANGDFSPYSVAVFSGDAGAGSDLVTVAEVREFLQKPVADTAQDEVIQAEISRASAVINRGWRKFRPAETAATKTFTFHGGHRLDLHPFVIRDLTSLTIAGNTIAADDRALRGTTADRFDGVYSWVRLWNTLPATVNQEDEVTIVGDWGYTSVPDDVKQACIVTVAEWMRRDVAAFSTTFSLDEDRVERPEAIPRAAKMMLRPYQRERQG